MELEYAPRPEYGLISLTSGDWLTATTPTTGSSAEKGPSYFVPSGWPTGRHFPGQPARARTVFERPAAFVNDIGPLAEEVDPTGRGAAGQLPPGFQPYRAGQCGVGDFRARRSGKSTPRRNCLRTYAAPVKAVIEGKPGLSPGASTRAIGPGSGECDGAPDDGGSELASEGTRACDGCDGPRRGEKSV